MRASPLYLRKVITITAEDSPNVKLALDQKSRGLDPTGEVILPGVLTWEEYQQRRQLWDEERQCIGLDAKFYVGPAVMLFPSAWLQRANQRWRELPTKSRLGEALGVDSAQGGDNTSYAVVDRLGLIDLISKKTKDTTVITKDVRELIIRHRLDPERVYFDIGGGGHQHADRLRKEGFRQDGGVRRVIDDGAQARDEADAGAHREPRGAVRVRQSTRTALWRVLESLGPLLGRLCTAAAVAGGAV